MFERRKGSTLTLATLFLAGMCGSAIAAPPADWSDIEGKSVVLFYPGQSTYEWLIGEEHKKGNAKVPNGASCMKCHEEDEPDMGDSRVDLSEVDAIEGKSGYLEMEVQAAYDADNLYMRFEWASDNEEWGSAGSPESLAILVDDGSVDRFNKHGCWMTCHNGMPGTEDEADPATVAANPIFGGKVVKKYLSLTRTDDIGTWDKTKSADDIAALRSAGTFLDLIQWKAGAAAGEGTASDSSVLETRYEADTGGSAGDVTVIESSFDEGTYTVVLQRKLDTGHPADDKILKDGGVYTLGLAVHDNNVDARFHHTALPFSLGLGADADLVAESQ